MPIGRSPALASCLAVVIAACGGGRPSPLPGDRPTIQLSVRALSFEMDAYVPSSVSPESAQVIVTSSAPLPGAPTATVQYETGAGWLAPALTPDASGGALRVAAQPGLLAAGTYRALVQVRWAGAANTPAAVAVELAIRPHPQTWRSGPPQRTAASRWGHTTTPLLDGGAVAAGGFAGEPRVERLEAGGRSWSDAGTLQQPRYNHTATLLADGRVFFAGGESQQQRLPSPRETWELWDPREDRVTSGGPLAGARAWHAAVRLLDGRVLLVGGYRVVDGKTVATQSCEIFDPASGTTAETGALHGVAPEASTPAEVAAVLLEDGSGRVLAVTWTPGSRAIGAELFDPEGERWTPAASRGQPRVHHGIAALPDGRVLVFGGWDPEASLGLRSAELYDPWQDAWTRAGELHVVHAYVGSAAVILPGGDVLVAGGALNRPDEDPFLFTELVETFDPATGAWSIAGALQQPLFMHTVTRLAGGSVWAVGGVRDADGAPELWRPPEP